MDTLKAPPHSSEAEQSVLSSILLDNECISAVSGILSPKDFYRADHAEIYAAMLRLHESNTPADVVMLQEELTKKGIFKQVGGIQYLSLLVANNYTSANVKYHALEVRKHSESRQIIKSITELFQKPENITASELKRAALDAEKKQYVETYVEKSMQAIDEFKRNIRAKKQRVKSGFKSMDATTGGFRIPSVAIIGAYPSVGKTAFALNIAANQERPVIFFSLEMSNEMIYERLASAQLKIDYGLFLKQHLSENQYHTVEAFTEKLKEKKFHVFDDAYYIEQQASIIAGVKPCLVAVDYIQKVKTYKKTDGRRHEIDYISGMYKQIARNNNCVILLLSQLSRNAHNQAKPTMANLKESGSLEADGDYVGILHRPYVTQKDNPKEIRPEDGYILIDKNKFGNTGQVDLWFNGKYQQFYEVENPRTNKKTIKDASKSIEQVNIDELPF